MSFDLPELRTAVATQGAVARVVIADVRGSSPREVGAAMLVWASGQSGTIGGGALEFEAAHRAREALAKRQDHRETVSLGPDLGQCCGGSVVLWTEIWDAARLATLEGDVVTRGPGEMPLSVHRIMTSARAGALTARPQLTDGWLVEPIHHAQRPVWVWGAGHVGRAIVQMAAPLPDLAITWVDTGQDRYPDKVPDGVTQLIATKPGKVVSYAPPGAAHLIVTYSHALDLDLCHRLLGHGFGFAGLIGSATKWARFRKRLGELGHSDASISRICCPIGRPEMGKHPQAIAVGVVADLLSDRMIKESRQGATG